MHNVITMKKLVSRKRIVIIAKKAKKLGRKIAFTNGCFDILHAGHVRYLAKAKKSGDILIVGLNSDSSVKRIKGPARPVNNQGNRAEVIAGLECVDHIVIFNESTPEKLIRAIAPDILVKGGDWKGKKVAGSEFVRKNGGKVIFVPLAKGRSTTAIIGKLSRLNDK